MHPPASLGGRNFESYSEDPFLAGTMATHMIKGVQSRGVAATIKHFVANEQETARLTVDETISERALREIYLRPFEIAIKKAKPWAVMTAYNLVNGLHCDGNEWLLAKVLRGEWGWKGLVISDWGGTNSVAGSLNAGLDLEMPGPARVRKVPEVLAAVRAGEVSEATIDERARTVLELVEKLGAFTENSASRIERAIDRPEHRSLIREVGARGIVLLKNDRKLLPLSKEEVRGKKIAVIGFAKDALAHGGGSASVNAHYKITPWDAMHAGLGDSVELVYAKGVHKERLLPPLTKDTSFGTIVGLDGQPGFSRLLYDLGSDSPVSTLHGYETSLYSPLGSQESLYKNLEIVGDFTPAESGNHYIACSGIGATQVFVDEQLVFRQEGNCSDPMGALFQAMAEEEGKVLLRDWEDLPYPNSNRATNQHRYEDPRRPQWRTHGLRPRGLSMMPTCRARRYLWRMTRTSLSSSPATIRSGRPKAGTRSPSTYRVTEARTPWWQPWQPRTIIPSLSTRRVSLSRCPGWIKYRPSFRRGSRARSAVTPLLMCSQAPSTPRDTSHAAFPGPLKLLRRTETSRESTPMDS